MEIIITQDLVNEPVTTDGIKQYIKFAYDSDVSEVNLIDEMISAVRAHLEMRTGLVFGEKTFEIRFNEFDGLELHHNPVTKSPTAMGFELPVSPIDSISSVKTIDLDDNETSLEKNDDYYVKGKYQRTIIYPLGVTQELVVTCTAGYGTDNTESLPADIKEAIKKQVGRWYWYRDDYREGTYIDEVKNIINRYV
jgi:uncharacterized phiE125 gp8 family phage protein